MEALTVLSYGGGQDSTSILLKAIYEPSFKQKFIKGRFIVVMADTVNEHDHTYNYLPKMQELCKENGIPFFLISPEEYASNSWKKGLIGFYEEKNAVGSKAFPKTCTDNLKIRPIYKFLEQYVHTEFKTEKFGRKSAFYEYAEKAGKIRVLIGIARKEEKRASENGSSGIKWFDQTIEKVYPLIEEGMDRQDCQDYIASTGFEIPFPSNCILCPFMSLQELLYLYRYERSWFDKWVELEANKFKNNEHKGKKNLGVWGTPESLLEILKKAEAKFGSMTKEELIEYKKSHGHCVMSKY